MPTFTYSPMRSEIYNPDYSKSRVGVLTEYFRNSDSVEDQIIQYFHLRVGVVSL